MVLRVIHISHYDSEEQNSGSETEEVKSADIKDEGNKECPELEFDDDKEDVTSEEDDVGLDRALLDQVKKLTDRVDKTLAEEERCWFELENPRCRNRRPEFELKVRLDVINSIKCYQIKELLEVVKEVSIHYADAIDQVSELKKEVLELKAKEVPETDDDTDIKTDDDSEIKTDDDSDIDMDKDNIKVDVQSVADDMDTLSLMA